MAIYPSVLIHFVVFVFGLCIGSFLNVCIFRIPRAKSIVRPPSACPVCGAPIRFHNNIPLLSYALLKGRCRDCGVSIPLRYPALELATGLTATAIFATFGASLSAIVYFTFLSTLWVVSLIDIDHRIIPDVISLPGIPLFFLASLAVPSMTVKDALLGILFGGGSLYIVAWSYSALKKTDGMGGGDIKLLAMIGALIGWKGVLFTLFVGSALGTLVGVGLMITGGKTMKLAVPFAPFLSAGAAIYVFFGPRLINWYLNVIPLSI
ncbi:MULTISPECIES: prepilin peptidase [Desulfococcus]|jgi:leader peptidase (prepilin peptidase)/N-methyltransferase|uniref:Prepilin leader peptidase/N-methyltransferase n=1 Tax=Desulfococcus multivorans DSM 2059 TaxID=1121405 RepID=S7V457_DESML|nr:A24 family peptidase [Desulfococcus multivorans]AOY58092.1 PilD: type 4 prepilin-like proteins leader peptide-processing enzyme [Desulfococcus multivorans]AQV00451.1 prepilin peptidase [Desulfococcus multivorans]EPR41339.1 peptidase A24A domain protein [Desulfococcus multivorans DSM 2059]MDX9818155.1 A24 family peptidase [Desulfococcus multivorans]SJZ72361.1 type 4 prepilin peptidase 1 Aspartic peptidase. MEROPS family A24A [Desulfococcus multivorans DSM 2059]